MIKIYQKEWHGIRFDNFTICDKDSIATNSFYDKFYKIFFKKFDNFKNLDREWVKYKLSIAKILAENIDKSKSVLSIGCGIGIVEDYLAKNIGNIKLTAIEPSSNVSRWIVGVENIDLRDGYFPDILDDNPKFDVVYANSIDYIFNDDEYDKFLKSIVNYGIKEFILISVSYHVFSPKRYLKDIVKDLLSSLNLHNRGQFWGYSRTIEEQYLALRKAGFDATTLIYQNDNTIIIKAK